MNKYGQLAQEHWRTQDPARYATIQDPQEFFSTLGEQVESQIQMLSASLAGSDPVGEQYLEKVARLNMARLQAQEAVLAETVLIPAPTEDEQDQEEDGTDPLTLVMQAQAAIDRARAEDEQTL